MFSKLSIVHRISVRTSSSASLRSYNSLINAKDLVIEKTQTPKAKTPYQDLVFGRTFTDHMLEIDWDEVNGWHSPRISPYGDFKLSPAATCLHYGIQCFEGMKAFKDSKGTIRMFRPDKNMERMNHSMTRLAMPAINGNDGFLECIKQLIKLDESWVPDKEGYSLYIRPTAIGTSPFLGVHASEQVKLYCILSPVGPYYKSGFNPVKLYADTNNVRAWPGGVGNAKVGGNYAPTIKPSQTAAKEHGASQILWLYGNDHQVTEGGAMNIFFLLKDPATGGMELVTPPLTRGDILPGVTRDSVLGIAREWSASSSHGPLKVSERFITMGEVKESSKAGNLMEVFAAGTAAVINPVRAIAYQGQDILVPTNDKIGDFAQKMWKAVIDIQYGRVPHKWSIPI